MSRSFALETLAKQQPAGALLVEVSQEELARIQGGGDVQPETTTPCAYTAGVLIGIGLSLWKC
ncbi:lichenicidin A2 family type 2 lantibiotic [Neobacillus mesonae]|uniref:mersacidin family lantibiotic n=1 Tax=Neobacillus mesonae TaxID=1193713 RepID=UPI002E23D315|nr:mersacidin family lantibiotic [Neobacillus mesonae]MED4206661.1 mersacidin family lantibiotic [Neobacillus mesonae]